MPRRQLSLAMTADPEPTSVTAGDLRVALRNAHPADEYVTLFEVREAVGRQAGSRADAIVMSLWPSRGFEVSGFELKVARGDWLAELKNPGKADRIARYCDRWSVFAPAGVVRQGELPPGWGLWELQAGGSIRRSLLAAAREPEPMPRAFLASLMRARARLDADDLVALAAHHRREFEKRQHAAPAAPDGDAAVLDAERLRAGLRRLEEIRQATGIDLREFTPSQRWIERMRLADSPRLEHKLRLLRDLFADEELRARVDSALLPDTGAGPGEPS